MFEFKVPSLGADMDEAVLLEWFVKPGDHVKKGDVVAVVDTVKAAIDIEVFVDGVIDKLLIEPDPEKKLAVGTVLALIRLDNEADAPAAASDSNSSAGSASDRRIRISPAARKVAADLGVDLASVKPSSPGAAIKVEDVEAAAAAKPAPAATPGAPTKPAAPAASGDRKAGMRAGIAAAMKKSWREIPHYFLRTEVLMDRALARLEEANRERAVEDRILLPALYMRAATLALDEYPEFNGHHIDDSFRPGDGVHIGFAIALREGGLIAPAIRECEDRNLENLTAAITDLAERTRALKLKSSEMTDATITITSLGDLGADTVFGIIYPPQVALLGIGSPREKAVVRDGELGVASAMDISLAADHRQTDGRQGALFLAAVKEYLEDPDELFGD